MSSILEEIETQIAGLKTSTSKSNVGIVRSTGDGVARIEGLSDVMLNEMIEFSGGVFGLALNLEETEVGAILLGDTTLVAEGDEARTTGRLFASLVRSLIQKKPRNYLKVLYVYKRLLRLEVEKRTATIESATELAIETRTGMIENLKRKYGNDLAMQFVIKPDLLGGLRIRVGSDVWDSSVRNRLERLQRQL